MIWIFTLTSQTPMSFIFTVCMQDWADQGGGAHLSWEQLLRSRTCEEFPEGSQADRSAASHHCLWSIQLCARPCALLVSQQPTEIHWDLCTEGNYWWYEYTLTDTENDLNWSTRKSVFQVYHP